MPIAHLRSLYTLILALLMAMLCSAPASAQAPFDGSASDVRNVELLNHLPAGYNSFIRVRGDYAYTLVGSNLEVYDISDPARPVLTSTLSTGEFFFEPYLRDLIFMEDYAFLSLESGMLTLDLSDPARPVIQEAIQLNQRWITGMTLAGEDLYVTQSENGLLIMRMQADGTPEEVGRYTGPEGAGFYDMVVADEIGYVSLAVHGDDKSRLEIHVLDLADPTQPQRLTTIEDAGGLWLQTTQERLYAMMPSASHERYELIIFDRTTPQQPVEIGRYSDSIKSDPIHFFPVDLEAWGGYVLLNLNARLQLIDLQDVANPKRIDTAVEFPHYTIKGDLLYLIANGLHIYDLTALPALDEIGAAPSFFNAVEALHLRDGYAFVTAGKRFHVLDITTPFSYTPVAEIPLPTLGRLWGMLAEGDRLFGTVEQAKPVINIADPRQPTVEGQGHSADATVHAVVGDRAYLLQSRWTENDGQLRIMDISAPDHWKLLGTLDLSGQASSLAVQAGRAYILLEGEVSGLAVVDVTHAAQPRLLDIFEQFSSSGFLVSTPGWLYLIAAPNQQRSSVQIIDIADPDNPVNVSTYAVGPRGRYGLGARAGAVAAPPYLYLLTPSQGLYVLDIADPSLPLEAGRYHYIGSGYDIAVDDQVIGVAHAYGALSLYRFTPPDETLEVANTDLPIRMDGGRVTYTLPEGFASTPISLTHASRSLGLGAVSPSLLPTGIVFRVHAVDAASGEAVEPDGPFTITLDYAALDVPFALDKLMLMRWDGSAWQPSTMAANASEQVLTATSNQFGTFALMVQAHQLHLPHAPQ